MDLTMDRNTPASRFGPETGRVEHRTGSPGSVGRDLRGLNYSLPAHLLLLLILACGNAPEPGPGIRIRVAPTPPTVGTARILVQVRGVDVPPASGSVTGRALPDGVGTPVEAEVSGPGTVSVPEFAFTQPGAWRLVAVVRLVDGSLLRDSTDVRVVEGLNRAPDPPES